MSDEQYEAAGELLRVLSAPIRLAIITRLASGPATVSALTAEVGHSQPLVSQHLRILRAVRLVRAVSEGRERIYELVDDHVAHIVADAVRHTAEPGHAVRDAEVETEVGAEVDAEVDAEVRADHTQNTVQRGNRRLNTATKGRAAARPRSRRTP